MNQPEIRIFPELQGLAQAAAQHFLEQAQINISSKGRFNVALSGGSTPKALHKLLASEFKGLVDWKNVNIYWGDERVVPPDHPESNYQMAKATLLDLVDIEPGHVQRIEGELSPQEAAAEYEQRLRASLGDETPLLDLIFLGMGADGHTASLFPNTAALDEKELWVVANRIEKMDTWRVTLTAPFINLAKQVTFLVAGESKAAALQQVLEGPHKPEQYPSQLIRPKTGKLLWLVDQAAASRLTSPEQN